MDFKTQVTGAAGLKGLNTDALLVLLASGAAVKTLDKPLADETPAPSRRETSSASQGACSTRTVWPM